MMKKRFGKGCRVGIDVGGTFTDFVLVNGSTGAITRYKEPSVPEDPSRSVEQGIPALIERARVKPNDIDLIVHGTTLGLNAIIQRRGARLGLVVSRGNRGVLEIGRTQLPNAFSFRLQKEKPLVRRQLVLETGGRLLRDGSILHHPDPGEIEGMAEIFRNERVDAITVMLLHSYANPKFEQDIADRLHAALPGVPVTASAQIWPEQREFERSLVALLNSYVQPIMDNYLERLQDRVAQLGIAAPIYITANNGGTLSLQTARARPIDTILSGPASGVVAASIIAQPTGLKNYITVDMGGTSADMSVIQNGHPEDSTLTHVGELPIIVPVVSVSAIGAGGGSIVWVDKQGMLKVGPRSAGASPGPICYGRGGTEPTVTDCYLVAGLIDGEHFLGGRMKLDKAAAICALEAIADRIGITGVDRAVKAAEATLRVTTAVMSTEITKNITQRGEEVRDYALVPFGGAGPTQANLIAEDCDIGKIIVPYAPSTFCAFGAVLSDVKRDYVRSNSINLNNPQEAALLPTIIGALEAEAGQWIASEGAILAETYFEYILEMRYAEQAYDLRVPLTTTTRRELAPAILSELFHQAHERSYNYRDVDTHVVVTAVRVRVIGKVPSVGLSAPSIVNNNTIARRQFYWNGVYQEAGVYLRQHLGEGSEIHGPAIVEQEDTTVLVLGGWRGLVDGIGNLIIERIAVS